tara:strand:- start:1084 stop:1227 length:144 start_codon:yes stop_codon:yes gene_type:complete
VAIVDMICKSNYEFNIPLVALLSTIAIYDVDVLTKTAYLPRQRADNN